MNQSCDIRRELQDRIDLTASASVGEDDLADGNRAAEGLRVENQDGLFPGRVLIAVGGFDVERLAETLHFVEILSRARHLNFVGVRCKRNIAAKQRQHSENSDEQRERLIESCRTIVELAVEREWKESAAARMRELIAERSPEQVAKMERERGLRAS